MVNTSLKNEGEIKLSIQIHENWTAGVYYKRETKSLIWKDTYIPMFIAALSTIASIWKQPVYW